MREYAEDRGAHSSRRGFTLVELMVVLSIIAIVASIALPNLIEVRKRGNEAAAVGALKAIVAAQSIFREQDKDHNGTLDYASDISMLYTYGKLVDPYLGVPDPSPFTAATSNLGARPITML